MKVNKCSTLFQSAQQNDTMPITGLDTPITVAEGSFIVLQITVRNLIPLSATIQTPPPTSFPDLFIFTGDNNDELSKVNLILGYLVAVTDPPYDGMPYTMVIGGDEPPTVLCLVQCVKTHLLMQSAAYGPGFGVIMPMPYHGPYIAPA